MIVTNNIVKSNLLGFSNKDTKLSREVKNGKLIKIKRGLYETDSNTPGYLLAGSIYGPSYLSFDYALSYYGLIPERVYNYTSATYNKKKKKLYNNHFGVFLFRDVPSEVYPLEVKLIEEGTYFYQIATKEKALCDKLYTLSPLKNFNELENMLFEDLRIDEDEFKKLDYKKVANLAQFYHSTNVELLARFMKRNNK